MDPRVEYAKRKKARSEAVAAADERFGTVANLRVLMVVLAVATGWWAHATGNSLDWSLLFIAGFVVLLFVHARIAKQRAELQRAVDYYTRAERRLDGLWIGDGDEGNAYVPAGHPYAFDVDAFGRGSLFQLLAEPRTQAGDRTLASWLLSAATIDEIKGRQTAVAELAPEIELRELLSMRANESRPELDADDLVTWSAGKPVLQSGGIRWLVHLIGPASLAAAIAWLGFGYSIIPLLVLTVLGSLVTRSIMADVRSVTGHVEKTRTELRALMHMLSCFAGRSAKSPWLAERYGRFSGAEAALARLVRLIDWFESRRHQLFAPIAYLLLWAPTFAFWLEDWRRDHGREVRQWLRIAGELEAVSSIARRAFEHPDDRFPELVDDGTPTLVAIGVRHPLMQEAMCVPNDVSLSQPLRMLLVSGSNMSGKSTLLRTLGLNVVLALLGAPVRATRFQLTPMQIAATLRVQDSLHEGASRFFAEIARLKVVSDCTVAGPTLFLLDEILSGTNSHDRRIGTAAVVRHFLERHAIGLVTTHDLALTEIVASLGDRATNVHFEDQMDGATLRFDYQMRPGVVQKSNAIELMRAVGLEV